MDNLGECFLEEKGEAEKDEVQDCLDAEKKAETCTKHCKWKCGRAMKKGIIY